VNDGWQALNRLLSNDYFAALLDWELPGCSGIEVAREFRVRQPGKKTHLVAVTAYNTKETREACIGAGMDAFLAKPVQLRQLATCLNAFIEPANLKAGAAVDSGDGVPAVISLRMLHYACQENGGSLREALPVFLAKVDGDLSALQGAISALDRLSAKAKAHALAGHGAFVCADHFTQLSRQVQELVADGDFQTSQELTQKLQTQWLEVRCTLENHLAAEEFG
jgi:CheY-like chemotaxis protein